MLAPVLAAAAVAIPHAAFAEPPVSDSELAQLRGGFSTPGGLDIAIAVQTDTRVDGNLVLRTVFRVDDGPAALRAYAPAPGMGAGVQTGTGAAAIGKPVVSVMFDRSNGVRFDQSSGAGPRFSVSTTSDPSFGAAPEGSTAVDINRDGAAVAVPAGSLSVRSIGEGTRISLESDGLSISHLVGSSFGSVIANTANDRMIDTATTIALDISGATPANLGSAMLQVDTLGTEAAAAMMPR